MASSKRDTARKKSHDSPKLKKEVLSKEMLEIIKIMEEYRNSLKNIEYIIKNINSTQKIINVHNKVSKTSKLKEHTETTIDKGNNFHIWYVRASDPWNNEMNNVVVSQIRQNDLIKNALQKKITEKVHSESKIYSILTYEGFEVPSMVEKNGKKNL
uniref:uncharacterized protein LOC127064901 n=1 Tax=Vespula vulgaris TaxID=7454 RepID=UPI00223C177C|nr:uncharacterized protein LOC127064901 [Vespula vulgaris]